MCLRLHSDSLLDCLKGKPASGFAKPLAGFAIYTVNIGRDMGCNVNLEYNHRPVLGCNRNVVQNSLYMNLISLMPSAVKSVV